MQQFKNKRVGGQLYNLAHLDPFTFVVTHNAINHSVRVMFEDHVFTEEHNAAVHTPDLIYSRRNGDWRAFNLRRWQLSLDLPQLFQTIGGQSVYSSQGRNFFFLRGNLADPPYAVFFEALKSNRNDADVSVFVRSAYEKDNMTKWASPVSFPRLIDAASREVAPPMGPAARIRRRR